MKNESLNGKIKAWNLLEGTINGMISVNDVCDIIEKHLASQDTVNGVAEAIYKSVYDKNHDWRYSEHRNLYKLHAQAAIAAIMGDDAARKPSVKQVVPEMAVNPASPAQTSEISDTKHCRFCGKDSFFTKEKHRPEYFDYCDTCMAVMGRVSYESAIDTINAAENLDHLFNKLTIKFPDEKLGLLSDIFDFFRPLLRTPKPVSLAHCIKEVGEFCENNLFDTEIVVKKCLDAAGVKYGH